MAGENGSMTDSAAAGRTPNLGKKAKDLNDAIRYTMWSVFHLRDVLGDEDGADVAHVVDLPQLVADLGHRLAGGGEPVGRQDVREQVRLGEHRGDHRRTLHFSDRCRQSVRH